MKSISRSLDEPNQSIKGYQAASLYYDEATKSKIQRHLTDINDRITEEDIRNIDTNITTPSFNTVKPVPAAVLPYQGN
jgi:hypothetical protein